ncbi:MAG: hypothetical protein GXO85_13640 [Chlorobi bacterium]|nr:hypothetical protein [Chlorobiota bacterium]
MISNQLIKLIVISILFSTILNAQVDSSETNQGININFFNGYAVSYKWNTSNNLSYRIYLTLSSSLLSEETESNWNSSDPNSTDQTTEGDSDQKFFGTSLSFQFLFRIWSNNTFTTYAGIGPYLSYSHNFNKSENTRNPNYYHSKSNFTANGYGAGLISLFGVEAFLTNSISLYTEMHLTGGKTWSSHTDNWTSNNNKYEASSTLTKTGWNASFQLVKIGLGLYF